MPKYFSMFGQTTTTKGWRNGVGTNVIIMDIENNEVLAPSLPTPHSPRWFNGELYCLLSATGQLLKIDIASGKYDVVTELKGFVRGMAKRGECW